MPPSKKFDSTAIAEFCRTHSIDAASGYFNCSTATAKNACYEHGVSIPSKSFIERKAIAEWVRNNNSTAARAARQFKCSTVRVITACNENDVTLKKNRRILPASPTSFEVLAFLLKGFDCASIAEEMGLSRQRIGQIKERAIAARLLGPNAIVELKKEHDHAVHPRPE